MSNSKFPYFIPPDINGRDQEPVVYLYQRLLEQQHEIDELRLKLTLMEKKTGPVFSNPYKAQIIGDDGRAIELGSAPKPVFPPLAAAIKNVEEAIAMLERKPPVIEVVQTEEEPFIATDELTSLLDQLDNGKEHIFVTGGAGVGKSRVINKWVDEADQNVARLAPTGIAALRINGQTIHSFFHLETHALDEDDIPDLQQKDIWKIEKLDTLLIDEVSMVRADLMDAVEGTLRKYGPSKGKPFGGVRLVMVGDLFQLPPVVADKEKGKPLESFLIDHYGTRMPFFFHANCWRDQQPKITELTTVFRQTDIDFVDALNAIRKGTLSERHMTLLNERTKRNFVPPNGELWMRLVMTNRKAQEANELMIQQLPGEERSFTADIRADFGKDYPTEETLTLKPGAAVMFIRNDTLKHRWVNGTMAKVATVTPYLTVEVNGVVHTILNEKWESIAYEYDKGAKKLKKTVKGSFSQVPLKVAAASTVHRAQGTTLDRAILDLGWGTFADGQLYVALSRLRSLEGLVLERPIRPDDMLTSKEVQRFMAGDEIARPVTQLF